jgi:hypothetical protein
VPGLLRAQGLRAASPAVEVASPLPLSGLLGLTPLMGTVHRPADVAGEMTLGRAADAYLASLGGAEQSNTRRACGEVLRRMAAEFGDDPARSGLRQ